MRDTAEVIVRSPRIVERRRAVRAERRRRRARMTLTLTVVLALAAGAWAITGSTLFRLDRVTVVGASGTMEQQILAVAGLGVGRPALGLDLDEAAARIERMTAIESARVVREGTLAVRVEVRQRVPAVIVRGEAGKRALDANGFAVDARPRRGLPVIRERSVMVSPQVVADVLAVWKAIGKNMRTKVDHFEQTAAGLRFRFGDTVVIVGSGDRVAQKVAALKLVRARLRAEGKKARAIDLRAPARPAVMLF